MILQLETQSVSSSLVSSLMLLSQKWGHRCTEGWVTTKETFGRNTKSWRRWRKLKERRMKETKGMRDIIHFLEASFLPSIPSSFYFFFIFPFFPRREESLERRRGIVYQNHINSRKREGYQSCVDVVFASCSLQNLILLLFETASHKKLINVSPKWVWWWWCWWWWRCEWKEKKRGLSFKSDAFTVTHLSQQMKTRQMKVESIVFFTRNG